MQSSTKLKLLNTYSKTYVTMVNCTKMCTYAEVLLKEHIVNELSVCSLVMLFTIA